MTENLPFCPREFLYLSFPFLRTAIVEQLAHFYPSEYFNPSASFCLQAARSIPSSSPGLLIFLLSGSELELQI